MNPLRAVALTLIAEALVAGVVAAVCPVRMWMLRQAVPVDYFDPEAARPDALEQIRGSIWAFHHGIDRGLVVDAGDALAVFDTFDQGYAHGLAAALDRQFPGKPVQWVFYSHAHLDHIRGAAILHPGEIIGHADIGRAVADWPHDDIAPVTTPIDGDQTMILGDIRVDLLFLPDSHSRTLYAYAFPAERVLFAPDMLFVHTLPPFGLPDWSYPGYLRALDRLVALDVDVCVPSHSGLGTRDDLVAYRTMLLDFHEVAADLLADLGGVASSGVAIRERFGPAYFALSAKYGDWVGFDDMFVPQFLGQIGREYLGY